jgi:hypothetical protein
MEYTIFMYIRTYLNIPYFLRFILACFLIFISIIPIVLPIFPWSIFLWTFLLVLWLMLIVPWKKIKHVVKMRKWVFYLFRNFHKKDIVKYKVKDIKIHIRDILNEKQDIKK